MSQGEAQPVGAPWWQRLARPLVELRHPILLIFALLQAWGVRSDADWSVLSGGGRALFGPAPLHAYSLNPGLDAGPPSLAVVRGLNLLPGIGGELAAHLLLAALAWYVLFLAERWTVPAATWRSAPLMPGLLTLLIGVPVLQEWSALAGALPHVEDGLALLTFTLAMGAIISERPYLAGVLVGLTAAWKPWAVVSLPLLWGLPERRWRALLIGVAIPAACWLPFVVGDHSTFSTVSTALTLRANSTLHVLGLTGADVPNWWRMVELTSALAAASVAAIRRDWRVAFAAGCTARVLLDPAGFDYYVAGLVLATAVTERLAGLRPWRTLLLLAAMAYANPFLSTPHAITTRFAVLVFILLSWLHPWRWPDRLHRTARHAAERRVIPAPRGGAELGRTAVFMQVVPPNE